MVKQTAVKMASGGIYDQLGGGFHRYAVDAIWLVPHFEKMLYDNAQLIRIYLHLYQITGEEMFRRIAVETLEYVRREMLDASGGFYSSQDADSEGEEGKFFVWTPEEIVDVLGEEAGRAFCEHYDVTAEGNFEGKNILNVKGHIDQPAVEDSRKRLFEAREKRVKPFRDEKVLAAWNGLMLAAFAEAARVFGNDDYLDIAKRNADFLLAEMQRDGRLFRTWKDGKAKLNGYIEDYANVTDGLIEVYQASGDMRYLDEARRLADVMITEFWDEDNGGFFFTSHDHEELILRNKDFYDNATPSGNSAAADVLLRLAKFTGEMKYERFGSTVLRLAASQIARHPQGFGRALSALEFQVSSVKEIAIIGPSGNDLERSVASVYLPHAVIAVSENADTSLALLDGRERVDGGPAAYVCENFVCQRPVTKADDLKKALGVQN
jgi:uncharacterized protein YyaL (SSP411 family)